VVPVPRAQGRWGGCRDTTKENIIRSRRKRYDIGKDGDGKETDRKERAARDVGVGRNKTYTIQCGYGR